MAAILRRTKNAMKPRAHERKRPRGRRAALPAFVEPCLATLAEKAPDGGNWIHEIKFDGYRIQARLDGGKVKLLTRRGLDWTKKFPTIAEAIAKLPARRRVDRRRTGGRRRLTAFPAFRCCKKISRVGRHDRMVFYVFDLHASRRRRFQTAAARQSAKRRWRGCWRKRQSAGRCA